MLHLAMLLVGASPMAVPVCSSTGISDAVLDAALGQALSSQDAAALLHYPVAMQIAAPQRAAIEPSLATVLQLSLAEAQRDRSKLRSALDRRLAALCLAFDGQPMTAAPAHATTLPDAKSATVPASAGDRVTAETGAKSQMLAIDALAGGRPLMKSEPAKPSEGNKDAPKPPNIKASCAADSLWRASAETGANKELGREAEANCALLDAHYFFGIGAIRSLNNNGSWTSGGELLAVYNTEARIHPDRAKQNTGYDFSSARYPVVSRLCPEIFHWCRATTEVSLRRRDSDIDASFSGEGTVLRFDQGYQMQFNKWGGIEFGAGLTAPFSDSSIGATSSRVEPRIYTGLRLMTLYPGETGWRGFGELRIGVARDLYWERQLCAGVINEQGVCSAFRRETDHNRYYVDGTFRIPGSQFFTDWSFFGRIRADSPLNGNGPSDVYFGLYAITGVDGFFKVPEKK